MAGRKKSDMKLVPAELPKRRRTSKYTKLISEFASSNSKTVLVKNAPKNGAVSFRKAVAEAGLAGKVSVKTIEGETFLIKK